MHVVLHISRVDMRDGSEGCHAVYILDSSADKLQVCACVRKEESGVSEEIADNGVCAW